MAKMLDEGDALERSLIGFKSHFSAAVNKAKSLGAFVLTTSGSTYHIQEIERVKD